MSLNWRMKKKERKEEGGGGGGVKDKKKKGNGATGDEITVLDKKACVLYCTYVCT